MDSRTILAVALSLFVILIFQYFLGGNVKQISHKEIGKVSVTNIQKQGPKNETRTHSTKGFQIPSLNGALEAEVPVHKARDISVDTDLYHVVFSEDGATVKKFLLKQYKTTISPKAPSVNLIKVLPPYLPLGLQIESQPPIDLSGRFFEADRENLALNKTKEKGQLSFTCDMPKGIKVTKTYTFHQGSYWIDLSIRLTGIGGLPGTIYLYNRPGKNVSRYTFSGPSYYAQKDLHRIKLKKIGEKHTYTGPVDWIGYGDNYFVTALIPMEKKELWNITVEKKDEKGLAESRLTSLSPDSIDGGQGEVLNLGLYFGPKEINRLNKLGHHLSKAIYFGWFDLIAKPLLYVLKFFYRYTKNYGIAIIILTILIKIAFWPLAQKSGKSMKTMQKIQPKLSKLKEKYGDDKERLNKELMQLYKTYKVNPMTGCLPMLLQIPVFFGLYKVLLQSIAVRHAPFMLWINDLSAPDRLMIPGWNIPYLGGLPVLTLLMGASMYLQQKMSPSSLDPTQAKMMQFLPLIFTFMFINFPSGLVLYWLVNNILSIAQQHYINKFTS
ncbi:MAG: membrane protein insertase YidC [Nitrospiraceae bacterium]|nr:membrane protein insertase YidC [Nitrospiraceae bacterium]